MSTSWMFIAGLAAATFGVTLLFIYLSKRGVEKRMEDPNAETSALAKDGSGPNAVERINRQSG
ncbi:MAG: hypothetical protein AAGF68_06725 [Pseudomonadota bacterium]